MQPNEGFRGRKCKKCVQDYHQQYKVDHKEELNKYNKQYYETNKTDILIQQKQHYEENKEERLAYAEQYRGDHKEEIKEYQKIYQQENMDAILAQRRDRRESDESVKEKEIAYFRQYQSEHKEERNERERVKRQNDPSYRLRINISTLINFYLKKEGSSKNGASCMEYIPWTIEEFWQDFEMKFALPENLTQDGRIWMHRDNQGKYDPKTWNEDDSSTWKWQLDHIIPQSDLPYTSMEDENFKKCWALENIRPLSAKQNILDGVRRTRHKRNNPGE